VVSHRCAAALWGLAGFARAPVELVVPRRRKRALPGIVHRPLSLPDVDVTVVDAIPVTTPARTLIDVAGVAHRDAVEEALDDALRRGLVTLARIRWRLEQVGGMGTPGSAALRQLVEARSSHATPASVLERRWLRVMRRTGLPDPELQREIREPSGRLVARVDFAYPYEKLAIEADGRQWHSGRRRFEEDRARQNALLRLGWRVIRVTWSDLEDPRRVLAVIREALSPSRRRR
jgi:very-short-patch-repair endonuclease